MTADINMRDPGVQKLMGGSDVVSPASGKRQMVQIAGDAPDPTGMSGHVGMSSTTMLTRSAIANPVVTYGDMKLTLDVYKTHGEPMMVHLLCPKCRNALSIKEYSKKMELTLGQGSPRLDEEGRPYGPPAGMISIEPFECTWELDGGTRRVGFGLGLCRQRLAIENNIAKDA